jgi:hypothetical protein
MQAVDVLCHERAKASRTLEIHECPVARVWPGRPSGMVQARLPSTAADLRIGEVSVDGG